MEKTLLALSFLLLFTTLQAQQLYFLAFSGLNKTAYNSPLYGNTKNYLSVGGRIAAGLDHLQLGAEYHTNLTNPPFNTTFSDDKFKESYYGAFIRTKISKYPAMRFGLVLRAGAGFFNTQLESRIPPSSNIVIQQDYDPILGFNGGVGFSIPTFKSAMLEIGYTYNYVDRPRIDNSLIEGYTASFHTIHAGLSLNFVFGKRAEEYKQLRENRRFRNG